jgi:uncharacterized protein (DUF433 family)
MAALEQLVAEPPPFALDGDGVLRVGGTRVRLETILEAFHRGCSAEEILLKYSSLNLTDIYATITYYLWHREEVDTYVRERSKLIEQTRREVEAEFPSAGVRERLLARRSTHS